MFTIKMNYYNFNNIYIEQCDRMMTPRMSTISEMWVCFLHGKGIYPWSMLRTSFPGGASGKVSAGNAGGAGDPGSIPGLGRHPGGGYGNPLQHSCLENSLHGAAWWATVRRLTKCWTQLKWLGMHAPKVKDIAMRRVCWIIQVGPI